MQIIRIHKIQAKIITVIKRTIIKSRIIDKRVDELQSLLHREIKGVINKKSLVKRKSKRWKLTEIDTIKAISFKENKENTLIGMNLMTNADNLFHSL